MANVLSAEKRLRVLASILDGNSVRATSRLTGVHQDTISRFALTAGEGAQYLHNRIAFGLACQYVEADEAWSYVGVKGSRVTEQHPEGFGNVWIWVAIDAVSKLVITWHAGARDQASADAFMADLRARLEVMPQITSDGLANYEPAIGKAFGPGVDHAQIIKTWRKGGRRSPDHRYEPPRDPLISKRVVFGAPALGASTTAHVERNHLTIRHMNGRLRRLCLAFSKRLPNHRAALALSYTWFNLGRVQRGMKITPAMAAGITDHVWELDEYLVAVMTAEPCEPPAKQPLRPRVPEGPSRELPNGRGFLRVVSGGKGFGQPTPAAPPPVPAPAPAAPREAASPAPAADAPRPLDPVSQRPKPVQLWLFELEDI